VQSAMHHAMNHMGLMISPELRVVQDGVHGCSEPNMVQNEIKAIQPRFPFGGQS
jgi:hypothetical protein